MKPLAIDLCAGLGGWTEGLLAEGFDCVGFDIERHAYGKHRYPAQLVLQDILTLDGRQFRGKASLVVASPPCQRYSYMAMPWTRAKNLITWHRDPAHPERITELNALFDACVRIGREAECPIVIENVRGAIPWVGRSRWNYGSYHLWGDVPALMPITLRGGKRKTPAGSNVAATRQMKADDSVKVGGSVGDDWFTHHNRDEFDRRVAARLSVPVACSCGIAAVINSSTLEADLEDFRRAHAHCVGSQSVIVGKAQAHDRATKNDGGSWFNIAHNTESGKGQNPDGRHGFQYSEGQDLCGMRSDGTVGAQVLWGDDVRLRGVSGSGSLVPDLSGRNSELEIARREGLKVPSESGRRTDVGNGARFTSDEDGTKIGGEWFHEARDHSMRMRKHSSKSSAHKAASARIAKIPLPLARHIARVYFPAP